MQQEKTQGYTIYRSEKVQLYICGQGLTNMAKMVDRLLLNEALHNSLWLNFGVAGSAVFDQGQLVVASQVLDARDNKSVNLVLSEKTELPRASVVSVENINSEYDDKSVFDMELAALAKALQFDDMLAKLVSIKLISDGPKQPHKVLNRNKISQLINNAKPDLLDFVKILMSQNPIK